MKSSTSILNPNAVSYIPLAKREGQKLNTESNVNSSNSGVSVTHSIVDDMKLKGQQVEVIQATPADVPHEMDSKFLDEESEMDLAYLQMMFPGVSDQSLADVYHVNGGDLEAAIEMLTDLESADDHSDASNIGETPEPVSSGECSSVKAVNVAGESSASSASSSVTVASS